MKMTYNVVVAKACYTRLYDNHYGECVKTPLSDSTDCFVPSHSHNPNPIIKLRVYLSTVLKLYFRTDIQLLDMYYLPLSKYCHTNNYVFLMCA